MKRADVYFALKRLVQAALVLFALSNLWPGAGAWSLIAFAVLALVLIADKLIVRLILWPRRRPPA
jgi:hypothetical protein